MAGRADELSRLIAEIEHEAYNKGWSDAVVAMTQAAGQMRAPTTPGADRIAAIERKHEVENTHRRHRRGSIPSAIMAIINESPGLTGAEIAGIAKTKSGIKERSMRSALRRLRAEGEIVQRQRKWHPAKMAGSSEQREMKDAAA